MEPIVNKIAQSGLVTIDLKDFFPAEEIEVFDIKPFLFMGMILKEKDFRLQLKEHDWSKYKSRNVAITCTADAIIPMWAYMLVTNYLMPFTQNIFFGDAIQVKQQIILKNIDALNENEWLDKRVLIKGCGDAAMIEAAYVAITKKLMPVVKSIMYGEACSSVPVYKKK